MVLRATVPPYDTRGVASASHPLARLSAATRLFTPATAIHTRLSAATRLFQLVPWGYSHASSPVPSNLLQWADVSAATDWSGGGAGPGV